VVAGERNWWLIGVLRKMNLIVRVKRRRSQDPTDSLWIVDDAGVPSKKKSTARQITDSLQSMTTSNNDEKTASKTRKLFLQRIQTVEVGAEAELDKSALSASVSKSQKRGRIEIETSSGAENAATDSTVDSIVNAGTIDEKTLNPRDNSDESSSMWITSGKKVLRSNYTLEKFVVVDVSQIPFSRPSATNSRTLAQESSQNVATSLGNQNQNPSSSPKKSAVIDPATRKLDAAIEKAFKLNDFNEMAQALQIGASKTYFVCFLLMSSTYCSDCLCSFLASFCPVLYYSAVFKLLLFIAIL
jgi:hypothetical protein